MCRPARWLPGLIPLLLLFLAAVGLKFPEIREDLTRRAQGALAAAGPGESAVSVAGRDVSLRGMSYSEGARSQAVGAVEALDGVRLVAGGLDVPPVARPYRFSAARDGDAIALEGSAPTPEIRAALAAVAKGIAPRLDDRLGLARGAADGFESWAKAALAPLSKLTRGSAELVDGALSVAGEAADTASYRAALAATQGLPPGVTLAKADIKAPLMSPYAWSAASDGKNITLEGSVPDEATRSTLIGAAKAALPGLAIVDRLQIARGAAAGFADWAQSGLAALGKLARGKVALSDAALTLSGEAVDDGAYRAALAATKVLPPGLTLAGADIAAPVRAPFAWSASSDGMTITLDGYVPSEEARAAILAGARAAAPGLAIGDRMQIARGAPADFAAAARAAIGALGRLASGKAVLSDLKLSLSGVTKGADGVETFVNGLPGLLPRGFAVADAAIRPPEQHPWAFEAKKDASGALAISGFAPSSSLREGAIAAARRIGANLSGDVAIASGLPAELDFAASTALGFDMLAALQRGEMKLGEDGLTVRGEGDQASIAALRARLAAPPAGVRIRLADLTALASPDLPAAPAQPVPPPPLQPTPGATEAMRPLSPTEAACQHELESRLMARTIQFRTSSADIEKESEGLIEDLSGVLKGCPDVRIEIGGHTDNLGEPEFNKELSLARAKAVVDALVTAGVAADRLSAAGYGDEHAIATNDTREGRAQNRRTTFVVK